MCCSIRCIDAFDNEDILKNANKQAKTMNAVLSNLMNDFDFIGDVRG